LRAAPAGFMIAEGRRAGRRATVVRPDVASRAQM